MSAEVLRRAAALMRERAKAVTPDAAWTDGHYWIADYDMYGDPVQTEIGGMGGAGDAAHYSAWHPAVALAVADLLDLAAGHEKREGEEAGQGYTANGYGYIDPSCSICGTPDEYAVPWPCAYATRGLAVARAYLNEEA